MEVEILADINIYDTERAQRKINNWTSGPLNLSYLLLYELPHIPTSITQLYCIGCHLFVLAIPTHLTFIDCSHNSLTALPELPHGLRALKCDNNQITSLPQLPSTLERLVCRTNPLEFLPELPHGFVELLCSETPIRSLPTLPSTLHTLKCNNNELTSLPPLPKSLQILHCSYNLLTELPTLPEYLEELDCRYNPIHTLPDIHPSMTYFLCNESNELARRENEDMYVHLTRIKDYSSQRRVNIRCKIVKEGIMMKAWHPSRIERLLLAGFDIEDM